jgi:hypothetical protein
VCHMEPCHALDTLLTHLPCQDEVKTTIREFLQKDGQYDKYGKAFESKCDLRPLHKALQVCSSSSRPNSCCNFYKREGLARVSDACVSDAFVSDAFVSDAFVSDAFVCQMPLCVRCLCVGYAFVSDALVSNALVSDVPLCQVRLCVRYAFVSDALVLRQVLSWFKSCRAGPGAQGQ